MKICTIIYTYPPYSFGGGDIYAEKIVKELARRGNSNSIITINPENSTTVCNTDNIKIYRLRPFNVSTFSRVGRQSLIKQGLWTLLDIYNPFSYLHVKQIIKKEAPDIVHIHTPVDMTLSVFDAVKHSKVALVFTLHDYLLLCRRMVLLHGFKRICAAENVNPLCRFYRGLCKKIVDGKIDTVIAPSRFILGTFKENGFFKNCHSEILPYGIKLDGISHIRNNQQKSFDILYVGNLRQHKGVHLLIKAVKQIKNQNLRLHIVGDGVYRDALTELAKNDSRIIFYGKINNDHIDNFYRMASVLVVPSIWYEVLGIVIQEAFRAGLPVIGSRIGGIPELIKDNHNGFLFNAGDAGQLREILHDVITSPKKLDELGKNARESVEKYEMSAHIDKLLEIYSEAIGINNSRNRG